MNQLERFTVPAFTGLWITLSVPALAAPAVVGGGAFEYGEGLGGQRTRSVLAIVGVEADAGSASLAVGRWFDDVVGDGTAYVLGVGKPLGAKSALRVWGSRFVGDGDVRAWRVKLGPIVELSGRSTAGLYYLHDADNVDRRWDGLTAEFSLPLGAQVTGRAAAGHTTTRDGPTATVGTLGLGWMPVHGLELTGGIGIARNGASAAWSGPSPAPSPFGGQAGTSTEGARVDRIVQLGIQVLLP